MCRPSLTERGSKEFIIEMGFIYNNENGKRKDKERNLIE